MRLLNGNRHQHSTEKKSQLTQESAGRLLDISNVFLQQFQLGNSSLWMCVYKLVMAGCNHTMVDLSGGPMLVSVSPSSNKKSLLLTILLILKDFKGRVDDKMAPDNDTHRWNPNNSRIQELPTRWKYLHSPLLPKQHDKFNVQCSVSGYVYVHNY